MPQKGMPPAFSTDSAIGTDATKKVQVQTGTPAAEPVAAEPAPTAVKPAAEAKGTEKKLGCFGTDSDSQRACVIS